jgi:acetate kinase
MSKENVLKILVLNCGSSSIKFQFVETSPEMIEANQDRVLAKGGVEKIGTSEAIVSYEAPGKAKTKFSKEILDHQEAVKTTLDCLTDPLNGVIEDPNEIDGVGHRVVHGGEKFAQSVLIDSEVVQGIVDCIDLAPLHNPHNLKGYQAAQALLSHAEHAAIFDTAFHQTLPRNAYLYGLPYVLYSRHKIRRYGFHGTSHRYVSYRFGAIHNSDRDQYKLITCHLGNGCSICAIDHGKSVDTSMGFTPLEGLMMGTRTGDLDPAAVLYIMAKEELQPNEVSSLLNKHSGLYGLSGSSNDMRTLIEEAEQGNDRAQIAIDVFAYRAKKYIGAYYAAMDGADAIIFTGGIGERAPLVRAEICEKMTSMGIKIDTRRNNRAVGEEGEITTKDSETEVWVIPTNEELVLARDTLRCMLNIPHP